jgi:hypothetical protein
LQGFKSTSKTIPVATRRLAQLRSELEVMARGRWSTLKCLRRYTQPSQVKKGLLRIHPEVSPDGKWCLENPGRLVLGLPKNEHREGVSIEQ